MARQLILIAGESTKGKTFSLRNFRKPSSVFYLCTEANKPLPFAQPEDNKFKTLLSGLEEPKQLFPVLEKVEAMEEIETIVIDTVDFLMDMYETFYIHNATDSRSEWGNYQQFFKTLMQQYVATSKKNWIFLAHNEVETLADGTFRYYVPVKGALKKQGIESYFNLIVYATALPTLDLEEEEYDSDLLHITPRDKRLKFKNVFQCDLTPSTVNSRIRAPQDCFAPNQLYIDNDAQLLLDHLDIFYGLKS